MNQGMYGMADGGGMAGRKFVGRAGMSPVIPITLSVGPLASAFGLGSPPTITLSSGVRQRLVSITGKGALRWASIYNGSSSSSVTFEVWLDGVKAFDTTAMVVTGNSILACGVCGNNTYLSVIPDWWPFVSSLELYVTTSVGGSTYNPIYVIDLHQ